MKKRSLIFFIIGCIIASLLALFISDSATAEGSFNVKTTICGAQWYCTDYTSGNCGTRTCIDINACGYNDGKPAEMTVCPPPSSGEGNTQSLENDSQLFEDLGYFTTDADIYNIDLVAGQLTRKNLIITSKYDENIILSIVYPQSYPQSKDMVKLDTTNLYLNAGQPKSIVLSFDAMNISPGIYPVHINISDSHYSKSIIVIINVNTLERPSIDYDIVVDSRLKLIGIDNSLNFSVTLDKERYSKYFDLNSINMTINLIDQYGNIVFEQHKAVSNLSLNQSINLPSDLQEGYYVLNAFVEDGKNILAKNQIITILPKEKYHVVVESPTVVTVNNPLIYSIMWIIFIIIVIALIVMMIIFRSKYPRDTKIDSAKKIYKENVDKRDKADILKDALNQGFITKKEYETFTQPHQSGNEQGMDRIANIEEAIKPMLPRRNAISFEYRVSDIEAFVLQDNRVLYSLDDLDKALDDMSDEVFMHHTGEGRNDFANWIFHVFKEEQLSKDVAEADSQKELKEVLARYKAGLIRFMMV